MYLFIAGLDDAVDKRETDQWHVEVARAAAVSSSGRAEVLVMTSRTVRREWKPTQRLRRDGMHI
jgi:hypothetical protein